MRLLIAVPPPRASLVRAATPEGCAPVVVNHLTEIVVGARSAIVDAVIVDPLLDPPLDADLMVRIVRGCSLATWLVYTPLSPEIARLMLDLGSVGVRHAIFTGIDDAPARLAGLLRDVAVQSVTQRAINGILSLVGPLPPRVRLTLQDYAERVRSKLVVGDLAARACMTRRTLERHFSRAGLPTPKTILLALRALTAYRLLYDGTMSCDGVAKTLGYGKASTLRAHLKLMFGVRAHALRGGPAPDIAVSDFLRAAAGAR